MSRKTVYCKLCNEALVKSANWKVDLANALFLARVLEIHYRRDDKHKQVWSAILKRKYAFHWGNLIRIDLPLRNNLKPVKALKKALKERSRGYGKSSRS